MRLHTLRPEQRPMQIVFPDARLDANHMRRAQQVCLWRSPSRLCNGARAEARRMQRRHLSPAHHRWQVAPLQILRGVLAGSARTCVQQAVQHDD